MIVRVGKVTNVYPSEGKVRVHYKDRNETSVKIPLLAAEYKMPEVGATVLTLHMEGKSSGFLLGEFWSEVKKPNVKGTYRKEFGTDSYAELSEGTFKIVSPKIIFQTDAGTVTMEQLVSLFNRVTDVERRVSRLEG